MQSKRMTLTIGPITQKLLTRLAAKCSMETNTSWTQQEVLERACNAGIHKLSTHYYPKGVVTTINH